MHSLLPCLKILSFFYIYQLHSNRSNVFSSWFLWFRAVSCHVAHFVAVEAFSFIHWEEEVCESCGGWTWCLRCGICTCGDGCGRRCLPLWSGAIGPVNVSDKGGFIFYNPWNKTSVIQLRAFRIAGHLASKGLVHIVPDKVNDSNISKLVFISEWKNFFWIRSKDPVFLFDCLDLALDFDWGIYQHVGIPELLGGILE